MGQNTDLIAALQDATAALRENTALMTTAFLKGFPKSEVKVPEHFDEPSRDLPVGTIVTEAASTFEKKDKPVNTDKKKPLPKKVVVKDKEAPAQVPAGKKKITFANLRIEVLKWIAPLAKGDDAAQEEAQEIMMALLEKYTGGKNFNVENVPVEYYQNISDYIKTVEVK